MNRNTEIIALRKGPKPPTLRALGAKYNLSHERIRQICAEEGKLRCEKHHASYSKNSGGCNYCRVEKDYRDLLSSASLKQLLSLIPKFRSIGRDKERMLQKQLLIKTLIDKHQCSFIYLGLLFQRDRTTIMHIYNKAL